MWSSEAELNSSRCTSRQTARPTNRAMLRDATPLPHCIAQNAAKLSAERTATIDLSVVLGASAFVAINASICWIRRQTSMIPTELI